jgi:acyl-CoA thioester hydrolase
LRVRYPETDRMGVVHHAAYFVWFELGRTELMRELGCDYASLEDREGLHFPLRRAASRYHAPARYDELLEVRTRLSEVSGARVSFEYDVCRAADGARLASGSTEHAAVGADGRPRRLPAWLRARLTSREPGT